MPFSTRVEDLPKLIGLIGLIGLIALYVLLARLMVLLFGSNDVVGFLWLASGVALVAVQKSGNKYLPAVFLGALLGYLVIGRPFSFSLLAALRHVASIFFGIWLLKKAGRFDPTLHSLGDFLRILLLAFGIGLFTALFMLTVDTLGAASLAGTQSFNQRWTGHALGIVVVMPLLLVWQRWPHAWAAPRVAGEAVLILGLSFLVGQVVFLDWLHDSLGGVALGYWMFLFVALAAMRLGPHGTVLILACTALQGIAGAQLGTGFFASDLAATQLANYFLYNLCLSVVGMALATYFSGRKQVEEKLQESEMRLRATLDSALDGAITIDASGHLLDFNPAAEIIFGWQREEIVGRSMAEIIVPERHRSAHRQGLERFVQTRQKHIMNQRVEITAQRRDGSEFPVELTITSIRQNGQDIFTAYIRDITARKRAEADLQLAASVFSHSLEGIMITSADGTIIDVNDAFTRISGYSRDEAIGQSPRILKSDRHGEEFHAAMWRDLLKNGHWYGEVWNRHKSGEVYAVMQNISAVRSANDTILHFVALFADITQQKAHENQLVHVAHFDALTHLPNRTLLADRLGQKLAHGPRTGEMVAVCMLDLDGFKQVNDQLGHKAGDQLLCEAARRLQDSIRQEDTAARLGGDEFVLLLGGLNNIVECRRALDRVLAAIAAPYHVTGQIARVSASIGVSVFPNDGADPDLLLRQADQAMYQAKKAGKNRYQLFDPSYELHSQARQGTAQKITKALAAGQFQMYYQPKVDCRQGRVVGVEALVRWQHPILGLLTPAEFVPIIEQEGLVVGFGDWVLQEVFRQQVAWLAQGSEIPVCINVAGRQFMQKEFLSRLRELLAVHPRELLGRIAIDVVEGVALDDIGGMADLIDACHELKIQVALDDFGTGFFSLVHLKRLAVDELKIDKSLVAAILNGPEGLAIVQGVIAVGQAFRRQVSAEGVETIDQLLMLMELGCDVMQGYCLARPMAADDVLPWVRGFEADPLWRLSSAPRPSRDYFELLLAETNHRLWIERLVSDARKLPDEASTEAFLNPAQCRFGRWYNDAMIDRFKNTGEFHKLGELHQSIHSCARSMCNNFRAGRDAEALADEAELLVKHEEIRALLSRLRNDLFNKLATTNSTREELLNAKL